MKLPEAFEKKMKALLGEEYEAFAQSFDEPRHYGLRVNTSKIAVEEFARLAPFHLTPIPWVENGFYYEEADEPAKHPYYYAGLYYIQEPSAMTPASRLPIKPGERVLDLCAAPGGKATELGARLGGEGLMAANDISASRVKALLKNMEVTGVENLFLMNEVPAKIAEQFTAYFDKILVDAPCSGEGMFRKNPEAAKVWEADKPETCAKLQREIVRQAVAMLKSGGNMMYATCTFSPEENEQIAAWVLRTFPEMRLLEMKGYEGFDKGRPQWADGNPELEKCVRIWPHRMGGEGHFAALFEKRAGTDTVQDAAWKADGDWLDSTGKKAGERSGGIGKTADESTEKMPERIERRRKKGAKRQKTKEVTPSFCTKQEKAVLDRFFADVRKQFDWKRIQARKGQVYYVPEGMEGKRGLVFVRNGLYLGELKKDRFEPSQAFAMALKKDEYANTIDFSAEDARVWKYLKGESIEAAEISGGQGRGWRLVCVEGYPLGWGKLTDNFLKNKYLTGWRAKR